MRHAIIAGGIGFAAFFILWGLLGVYEDYMCQSVAETEISARDCTDFVAAVTSWLRDQDGP